MQCLASGSTNKPWTNLPFSYTKVALKYLHRFPVISFYHYSVVWRPLCEWLKPNQPLEETRNKAQAWLWSQKERSGLKKPWDNSQIKCTLEDWMYHESWQSRLLYWGGARLPCLHIIAGTDQTLRFITQSNLKPFTKKHAETPGAHVRLLGV